jgi:uncharacterized protein (DUF362 family)
MKRRRFLQLTSAGLACAGAGAAVALGSCGAGEPIRARPPAGTAAPTGRAPTEGGPEDEPPSPTPPPLTLAILAQPANEELYGRLAVARHLSPPGAPARSNLDPLPEARVGERLNAAMEALAGADPWRRLFAPGDTVAVKINGLAAGRLSPRKELVWAIVAGLRAAGVPDGRIIIWERTTRELERSGFPRQTEPDAVRVYGTDALRGGGYGSEIESCGAVGSFVSEVLTRHATALVNVGVLKDHDLAGVSAGMKNLYGTIHNPNRYHDHACDPYVAQVTALPSLRTKLRLTVIDAVLAQAQGGPAYAPAWIWPCDRLIAGVDPVAVDQAAWDLIEAERAARGLPRLAEEQREPAWIATAARMGLGRRASLDVREI